MAEISDNELEVLRQSKALLDGMWNGKQSHEFKKLLKVHNPELRIPEIDVVEEARKPIDEKLTAQEKRLEALQKKMEERETQDKDSKEQAALEKELGDVKKKFSLTEEGMNKVIERMKEKKSYDPEAAAAWVMQQTPKATPSSDSRLGLPGKMDLYGTAKQDKDFEQLHKDPMQFFDQEVSNIFENPDQYKEFGGQL